MINGKHVPGKGLPGAKQYDENLNNAIPNILAAVDGYKMQ